MDDVADLSPRVVMQALFQPEGAAALMRASSEFNVRGFPLGAGYTAASAIHLPMRREDREAAFTLACDHYLRVIGSGAADSLQRILALWLASELVNQRWGVEAPCALPSCDELWEELAQSLATLRGDLAANEYAVRGFRLHTDLQGAFAVESVPKEAALGFTGWSDERWTFNVPSAFTLARMIGDHELACSIATQFPDAFTSPGLRGWRAAMALQNQPPRASTLKRRLLNSVAIECMPIRRVVQSGNIGTV